VKYRTAIYLGAASVAEFFADILLTPLEATRIRLVSEKGFATGLVSGFTRLAREGGVSQLYAGFLPILCKFRYYCCLPCQPHFSHNPIITDKSLTLLANSLSMNSAMKPSSVTCPKRPSAIFLAQGNSQLPWGVVSLLGSQLPS
jgi:hypothetical protein